MKQSKYAYCDCCDKDVEYVIIEKERKMTANNGRVFTYLCKETYCKHCGTFVAPVSVTRENDLVLSEAHKKALGLLTGAEIKEIRKKLGLSQTRFAKLVGVGEKNIARYENGERQIKAIDDAIRRIANQSLKNDVIVNKQIGELLEKTRIESKLTIEDLSRKTKIAEKDITSIEKGEGDPKLSKITKLFKTLGKSITINVF